MKLVWAMTGSGDRIREIVDIMKEVASKPDVQMTVLASKAAEQVLRWYRVWDDMQGAFGKLHVESNANTPFLAGPLQMGKYDLLVVAPLTSNSAAKMAVGIADTLVTNCFAQTLKGSTPVLLYPVDQRPGKMTTFSPKGERVELRARDIDLSNVDTLRTMRNVEIITSPAEIIDRIESHSSLS